jgi:hypothetical protein
VSRDAELTRTLVRSLQKSRQCKQRVNTFWTGKIARYLAIVSARCTATYIK